MKPMKLTLSFKGGEDSIVQPGMVETVTFEAFNEYCFVHFKHSKHTRAFAKTETKDGVNAKYIERFQKTLCKYPGMTQQQIIDHIKKRINDLSKDKLKKVE